MMKKLLVLVAMLSLVVCANATVLFSLNVNGSPIPETGTIIATVGQTFNLSIYNAATFVQKDYANYGIVALGDGVGSFPLDVDGKLVGATFDVALDASESLPYADFAVANGGEFPDGIGAAGFVATWSTNAAFTKLPGVYVDNIVFTVQKSCTVELWVVDGLGGTTSKAGLVEFVVPELITVALLGLGGLFIRRK